LACRSNLLIRQSSDQPRFAKIGCRLMCRFSDAGNDEAGHALRDRRRKSAKARNRGGVGHRRCRGTLWGFSRGAGLGKVESNCPWPSHSRTGLAWTTGGAGVAKPDWQCNCAPILLPAVSKGSAGREPAGMAGVTGLVDRWWRHHEGSMLAAAVGGGGGGVCLEAGGKGSAVIIRRAADLGGGA